MKPRQRYKRRMHNVRQCDPVLADINASLQHLDQQLDDIRDAATQAAIKRGAVAGAMAGGVASLVVTTAVILIRARMGC
ncbi:hypothetical protein GB371_14650 [Salmonella enterica]|nr:hypothetical protein [Salmonella enterica]EDI3198473.1 hypothetical protein [Salmonella enterica subsp. enterica serovar Rubislaw]EEN1949896.1 hypothetical protein [Salmonella enterica subsp. enterica serovar Poona]EHJ0481410.1 hypothetical protein [Salmonella enterica subsp. enterica serovar Abaetetuba]ELJ2725089.1 hypothetical protein [Salmonella enterica subsp. enterica]